MTQEEARQKGNDKLKAIETLCRQLQVTVSAEQTITKEGLIKNIVLYSDNERYDIDDQKQDEKNDKETTKKPTKETTFLREKNAENSI
jgi:hypothetical protein